jgi:hypothetical protein
MDIDGDAPVITRDEIMISAPIQTVWNIQTDVEAWPSWQSDVDSAEADGPLRAGSVFRWQTAGLDITSTVEEIDPPNRIVWGGPHKASSLSTSGPSTNKTMASSSAPRNRGRGIPLPLNPTRCRPPSTARCMAGSRISNGRRNEARISSVLPI